MYIYIYIFITDAEAAVCDVLHRAHLQRSRRGARSDKVMPTAKPPTPTCVCVRTQVHAYRTLARADPPSHVIMDSRMR